MVAPSLGGGVESAGVGGLGLEALVEAPAFKSCLGMFEEGIEDFTWGSEMGGLLHS